MLMRLVIYDCVYALLGFTINYNMAVRTQIMLAIFINQGGNYSAVVVSVCTTLAPRAHSKQLFAIRPLVTHPVLLLNHFEQKVY